LGKLGEVGGLDFQGLRQLEARVSPEPRVWVGFVPGDGALRHPERVLSSPEKLNEDEAKGRTLKNTFTPSQINSVYIAWDTKGSRIAPVRCGRVSYVRFGDSKLYVHKVLINERWMYCGTS
jgi:hypothetical protein